MKIPTEAGTTNWDARSPAVCLQPAAMRMIRLNRCAPFAANKKSERPQRDGIARNRLGSEIGLFLFAVVRCIATQQVFHRIVPGIEANLLSN